MRILSIIIFFLSSCNDGKTKVDTSQESQFRRTEIVGNWIVVGSNIIPFDHISFCKNISLNSIFEFDQNGCLKVIDSKTGSYCNLEISQNYFVQGNILKMVEDDMLFEYKIQKLTPDTLILRIDRTPEHYFTDTLQNYERMENDMREISANGINVTLVRQKSGL